ncbi:MAG: Translation elongation factor 1 alpha-related protein [Methanothrix sp.]|nr:MAG: Translation elongation factor 1 alpha-related protein [Methanothrix sp.]
MERGAEGLGGGGYRKAYYRREYLRRSMANLNVAILGPQGYGKEVGKTGTSTDITFYNLKRGESTVTIVEPTRYPERLAPLFFAASLARKAVVVVDEIDAAFGESVIMLQALGIKEGYIILRNYIDPGRMAPIIKGTVLEGYEVIDDDPIALRERLLDEAEQLGDEPPSPDDKGGAVPIDHFFNVRGIGTVILGTVAGGVIRRHETVRVLPGERTALVRSIQKHDDDFDWAVEGDRTGIALKNIEAGELDRGDVLSSDGSLRSESRISACAELIRYWPAPLKEGMVLHIGHWMQFLPGRVASVEAGDDWRRPLLRIELEKPLVWRPGDRAVVCQLEGSKLRIAGTLNLP